MCGRVRHAVGVGRLAACRSGPEPEADVPRLTGVACLAEQNLGAGVQVVRRDPPVIAEIATDQPRVEVDDFFFIDAPKKELYTLSLPRSSAILRSVSSSVIAPSRFRVPH